MRLTLPTFHSTRDSRVICFAVLSGKQKGREEWVSRITGPEVGVWPCKSESLNCSLSVSICASWGQQQPQYTPDVSQPRWVPKCVDAWILKNSNLHKFELTQPFPKVWPVPYCFNILWVRKLGHQKVKSPFKDDRAFHQPETIKTPSNLLPDPAIGWFFLLFINLNSCDPPCKIQQTITKHLLNEGTIGQCVQYEWNGNLMGIGASKGSWKRIKKRYTDILRIV